MIRDPQWRRRAAMFLATAVLATQACSTGEEVVGTTPEPSISLGLNPTSATLVRGESIAFTATLTGRGGYAGAGAAFALTGEPAGVTFAVSSPKTSGSVTTATITTTAGASVTPGTYTITLTGSGTGVSPVTASFNLTVPAPSIAVSLNPASATVAQGGSVASAATLSGSGGFTGAGAAFALTGAPAGVTFAVSSPQTSSWISGSLTTATITTFAAATVLPGTYSLILTGSGNGVSPVSTSFALSVVAVGFTLTVNPATMTLCEGCGEVTATVTLSRLNAFTGSVLLSASSSSVGQGGSFTLGLNPSSTTGNSSILTVSTSAPPGDYTLTITGTAPGFATQTVTIAVTVL